MDAIWEDFRQLDQSTTRSYGGTGLGLSITRRLTHQLGGYVSVESDVRRRHDILGALAGGTFQPPPLSAIYDLTMRRCGNFPPVLVSVALPLPLFRNFTYEVDDADADRARPGMRAVVPFRNRREIGVIVGAASSRCTGSRRSASQSSRRDAGAGRSACSRSASGSPSTTSFRSASSFEARCPRRCRRTTRRRRRDGRDASPRCDAICRRSSIATTIFKRAPQQRALFELIESLGGRAPVEHLTEQLKFSPSVLKGLVERGLVTVDDEVVARDPFATRATPAAGSTSAVGATAARDRGARCRRTPATCSCCTA